MTIAKIPPMKFLIIQLGSLIQHMDKVYHHKKNMVSSRDVEFMSELHNMIKDYILLHKARKLHQLKPGMLASIEGLVSQGDYSKVKIIFENLKPNINVWTDRVARIYGRTPSGGMDIESSLNNITEIYENVKKLSLDAAEEGDIPDHTLFSIEAACEVIRQLVAEFQEMVK